MRAKQLIRRPILYTALCGVVAVSVWGQEPPPGARPQEATEGNGLASFLAGNLDTLLKANNVFFPSGRPVGTEVQTAPAGEPGAATEALFTLNFNNAGIDVVLKYLSDMTGKVVMRAEGVQGQITVMVPDRITKEKAIGYIEQALALRNFTIVETDSILIVLPTSVARMEGLEVDVGITEGPLGPRMRSQIVKLEHASASQLAEDLKPLMSENAMMIADMRTNNLIITDTGTNIERLTKIIKELDRAEDAGRLVTRIFQLKFADSSDVAEALNEVVVHLNRKPTGKSSKESDKTSDGPTKVLQDDDTNCLIVSGTEADVALIESFVEKLNASGSGGLEVETIRLEQADASALASQISQIFRDQRRQNAARATVTADIWTNSLIVSGFPEDIETVRRLAAQLDETKSAKSETRVYTLQEADASVLSGILSAVLTGEEGTSTSTAGRGGRGGRGGGFFPFDRLRGGGGSEEMQPRITLDTRLNALVITAQNDSFQMIEELIKELDVAVPQSKEEPRIFPLKYADARDIADLLNELFSDRESTVGAFFFMSQTRSISGLSGKLKVIADPATNSIVVIASSPRGFDVVEGLLKELDRISPEFGSTVVVPLRHANAEQLAESLTTLFEEDPRRQSGGFSMFGFSTGRSGMQEREISNMMGNVRVVADTRTNSLIVSTPQQNMEPVKNIIEELDNPTSQVLVEILIVELSSDSDKNLGIQWGGQEGSVRGSADFAFQTPFLTQESRDVGSRFRSTTLSSSQFDAVLNILARDTNTNVVARPNILTADNQEASVNVGKDIQYFESLESTEAGELASIEFRFVGLTLTVRPQINESTLNDATGVVTLDITVTTGDQALDVAGLDPRLLAFTKREVQTNVTVENGRTVVLSGVIDETWTDTVQGVPGLSKIPLLGNIFKNKRKIRAKTELITFITPRILDTAEQIQRVTDQHMQKDSYQYWLEHQKTLEQVGKAAKNGE